MTDVDKIEEMRELLRRRIESALATRNSTRDVDVFEEFTTKLKELYDIETCFNGIFGVKYAN